MFSFINLNTYIGKLSVFVVTLSMLSACAVYDKGMTEHYEMKDYATLVKYDAHVHANTSQPAFIDIAIQDNFSLISINVDYPEFPPIAEQYSIALQLQQQFTDNFHFVATFSMQNWPSKQWQQSAISHIQDTSKNGALGVKVWKNIGMAQRTANNDMLMIDDASFDTLFTFLANNNIPLVGHQGEPKNCWLPIEEMTVNNDKQYFARHPEYHMFLQPDLPSYEDQMQARNNMLNKHPKLAFMGAHLASLEWSVDELATFLDTYPLAVVDMAARLGQIQYQAELNRQKVRNFFITYQDRILYASDLTSMHNSDPEEFKKSVHKKWTDDWKYFNTTQTLKVEELDKPITGLALPKRVVDKLYRINAQRFFNLSSAASAAKGNSNE